MNIHQCNHQQYCDALSAAGFTTKIEEDGDISFKIGKATAFIEIEENNPTLFRIALPGIYKIGKENLHYALGTLQRIKTLDSASNVALIQIADDEDTVTFWITTELLTLNPPLPENFIPSKVESLLNTSETIDKFLREHAE